MAGKKEMSPELSAAFKDTLNKTTIIDIEVDNELKKSFIAYAMAVNVIRARCPDVRDGLEARSQAHPLRDARDGALQRQGL